jgi:hypothetical protein
MILLEDGPSTWAVAIFVREAWIRRKDLPNTSSNQVYAHPKVCPTYTPIVLDVDEINGWSRRRRASRRPSEGPGALEFP